jgi:hypothetical protein
VFDGYQMVGTGELVSNQHCKKQVDDGMWQAARRKLAEARQDMAAGRKCASSGIGRIVMVEVGVRVPLIALSMSVPEADIAAPQDI